MGLKAVLVIVVSVAIAIALISIAYFSFFSQPNGKEPIKYGYVGGSWTMYDWPRLINEEANVFLRNRGVVYMDSTAEGKQFPDEFKPYFYDNIDGEAKIVSIGSLDNGTDEKTVIAKIDLTDMNIIDSFDVNSTLDLEHSPLIYDKTCNCAYSTYWDSDNITVVEFNLDTKAMREIITTQLYKTTRTTSIELDVDLGYLILCGGEVKIIDIDKGEVIKIFTGFCEVGDIGTFEPNKWLFVSYMNIYAQDFVALYNYETMEFVKKFQFPGGPMDPRDINNENPASGMDVNADDGRVIINWGLTILDFKKEKNHCIFDPTGGVGGADEFTWDERDDMIFAVMADDLYKISAYDYDGSHENNWQTTPP